MNAPSFKPSSNLNVEQRFLAMTDINVRRCVTDIWLTILVTAYRDLMKKMQTVAGKSSERVRAAIVQCQVEFTAHPEYGYIQAHGSQSQQAHAQLLLNSLAVEPEPLSHIEPVVIAWASIAELRGRVIAALTE